MTTDYQPGRIYSGIVDGERRTLIRRTPPAFGHDAYVWCDREGVTVERNVTDVRGPLVVLDLGSASPLALAESLRSDSYWVYIADQIEEQTRPPRPDEPTNTGAVVRDTHGSFWTRLPSSFGKWADGGGNIASWNGIDGPTVEHDGWDRS